ncbi:hypothetical protein [Antarctobacter sp.]|uniref:hypothetical protein n=1 Tax=Antarctobacter sp. TaxID=1872577 RepID=UPI003A90D374
MNSLTTAIFLTALASHALAQEKSGYSFSLPDVRDQDEACKTEALDVLQKRFEGVKGISFQMPDFWDSAIPGVRILAYSDANIAAEQGDVRTQIQCLIYLPANQIVEVAFQFPDDGLLGSKSLPVLSSGERLAVQMHVANSNKFIQGAD